MVKLSSMTIVLAILAWMAHPDMAHACPTKEGNESYYNMIREEYNKDVAEYDVNLTKANQCLNQFFPKCGDDVFYTYLSRVKAAAAAAEELNKELRQYDMALTIQGCN